MCPESYIHHRYGLCLRYFNDAVIHTEASEICREDSAVLVRIDSGLKHQGVIEVLHGLNEPGTVFWGVHRLGGVWSV